MIRVEREESLPLAVIYDGDHLGRALKEALEKQNLRAVFLEKGQALPVLEKPAYVFFFAGDSPPFPHPRAKLIKIDLQGVISSTDKAGLTFSVNKIIRALSAGENQVTILGKQEIKQLVPETPKKKNFSFLLVLLVPLVLFPIFFVGRAAWDLKTAKDSLEKGEFVTSQKFAQKAKDKFALIKNFWPVKYYFDFLSVGETGADVIIHAANLGQKTKTLTKNMVLTDTPALRLEIEAINQDLGLIATQTEILTKFGLNLKLTELRQILKKTDGVLSVWPQIAPSDGKKIYLVVFQNSAELRPTGGFIGSYALVKVENGMLADWEIQDVYQADGQLKGTVAPPDEMLQFGGISSWYLRDANWDPDWALTAKRLAWFLEKEINQQVDGVIGVNLGLVQKLLEATGPLELPEINQTVSAADFFQKAEAASEINFFPGSSQKKDFLAITAKALLDKLTFSPSLAKALINGLAQKDLLFYFNDPKAQKVFMDNGWTGEFKNFDLALVEANLGFNKANFFVKRSLQTKILIGKDGAQDVTVTVQYHNDSPSEAWPGGKYKNYLRIFHPSGVFASLVEVPVQGDKTVSFSYRLPNKLAVDQDKPVFNFRILKQPGTGPDPWDLSVDYPSFLKPAGQTGLAFPQRIIYNGDLTTDRNYEIHFIKS